MNLQSIREKLEKLKQSHKVKVIVFETMLKEGLITEKYSRIAWKLFILIILINRA